MLRFLARVEPATVVLTAVLGLEFVCWQAWFAVAVPDAVEEGAAFECACSSESFGGGGWVAHGGGFLLDFGRVG